MHPLRGFGRSRDRKVANFDQVEHQLEPPADRDPDAAARSPQRLVVADAGPAVIATHHDTGSVLKRESAVRRSGFRCLGEGRLDDMQAETLALPFVESVNLGQHGADDIHRADVLTDQRQYLQIGGLIVDQNVRIDQQEADGRQSSPDPRR